MRRADNLTTFMCRLSWNLGASTSWNPQCLSKPVMGLLYLLSFYLGFVIVSDLAIKNCLILKDSKYLYASRTVKGTTCRPHRVPVIKLLPHKLYRHRFSAYRDTTLYNKGGCTSLFFQTPHVTTLSRGIQGKWWRGVFKSQWHVAIPKISPKPHKRERGHF